MPSLKKNSFQHALLWLGVVLFLASGATIAPIPTHINRFVQVLRHQLQQLSNRVETGQVYAMTDKTLYAPGETIWVNLFGRDDNTRPLQNHELTVELLDPKGSVNSTRQLRFDENGQARSDFPITEEMPAGRYKLRAWAGTQPYRNRDTVTAIFEKILTVQAVSLPRVKVSLDFQRKAYGPGDEVTATVKAFDNENRPLTNQVINWESRVSNIPSRKGTAIIGPDGQATVKFQLPRPLAAADGLLTLSLDHEGLTEAVARSIPIVLNRVRLDLLPEGGELVAGLPGRVAFRATNEFGQPADVAGYVTDERGRRLTAFRSLHDGLGCFGLTPQRDQQYFVHLTAPAQTPDSVITVPEPLPGGFTLRVEPQKNGEGFVRAIVAGTVPENMVLTLVQRDQVLRGIMVRVSRQPVEMRVPVSNLPAGVLQLTLFDSRKIARAERLVMVNAQRKLNLSVKTDRERYGLRQKVRVTIQATDDRGLPAPGAVALSVVDDQNLAFADDKQHHILSWLLAGADLQIPIYEPSFYFDQKQPAAAAALDMVLLTHGWRRFKWARIQQEELPANREITLYQDPDDDSSSDENADDNDQRSAGRRRKNNIVGNHQVKPDIIPYETPAFRPFKDKTASIRGQLAGRVINNGTQEPVYLADVALLRKGKVVAHTTTDEDGHYRLRGILPGVYDVRINNLAYRGVRLTGVPVKVGKATLVEGELEAVSNELPEAEVVAYKVPIIDRDNTTTGGTLTNETIMKLPTREVATLAATTPGTFSADNSHLWTRGTRESSTTYYVNGVKQIDGSSAPNGRHAAWQQEAQRAAENRPALPTNGSMGSMLWLDGTNTPAPVLTVIPNATHQPGNGYVQTREFVAPVYDRPLAAGTPRTDFRSTLFWKPAIELNQNGRAVIEFYTGDAVTSYRALVEGLSAEGRVGRAETRFHTFTPVVVTLKLPPHVTEGDTLSLPLVLANRTDNAVAGPLLFNVPPTWQAVGEALPTQLSLAPRSVRTFHPRFVVNGPAGAAELSVLFGDGGDGRPLDQLFQQLPVGARGYPVSVACSGARHSQQLEFDAGAAMPGSVAVQFAAFPTPESNLLRGIEAMLQEPHGCFEQTMSSTYPNAIVLEYLRQQPRADQALIAQAEGNLDRGYARLAGYVTRDGAVEWFGHGAGNEVLTAYALARFQHMYNVRRSDLLNILVGRAAEWLITRRQRYGHYVADDSRGWFRDAGVANAYIVWAMHEAGRGRREDAGPVAEHAVASGDPYQIALAANILPMASMSASHLVSRLYREQGADGSWMGTTTSAMSSSGTALRLETTALAVLAILQDYNRSLPALKKAVEFLQQHRNPFGGYGNTQSTFLVLKALMAYEKFSRRAPEDGIVALLLDGREVGRVAYHAGDREAIELRELPVRLAPGRHQLEVRYAPEVQSPIPYVAAVTWRVQQPPTSDRCPLRLTTTIAKAPVRVGENCRLTATLRNLDTRRPQPMPMALIGLPAGLSPQPWQLRELQEHHAFDYYELREGKLACYFRELAPGQEVTLQLDLKAEVPGTFRAPASVAYRYYADEFKYWTPGLEARVQP